MFYSWDFFIFFKWVHLQHSRSAVRHDRLIVRIPRKSCFVLVHHVLRKTADAVFYAHKIQEQDRVICERKKRPVAVVCHPNYRRIQSWQKGATVRVCRVFPVFNDEDGLGTARHNVDAVRAVAGVEMDFDSSFFPESATCFFINKNTKSPHIWTH